MSILTDFFSNILQGESKTYNDHTWYVSGNKLKGYIQGSFGTQYPLLTKPLSEYTVGEVMQFQSRGRDATGQLWATGRYQIIPSTLKGLVQALKLPPSTKYDAATQDKMGLQLLTERAAIRKYVNGDLADTTQNLEKAALEVAKIWSSVGVPFPVQGRHGYVQKNQSYYSGGGDKASVTTESVQSKLKLLRDNWLKVVSGIGEVKKKLTTPILIVLALLASWSLYRVLSNKPIIPKFK
jgi:hypothetical protein